MMKAYKMAVTDALSVALKALGVGADIYAGKWTVQKYREEKNRRSHKNNLEIMTSIESYSIR